jgi:GGDEF domain-containing protein/uncharacterized coiled-coil protein SlyX
MISLKRSMDSYETLRALATKSASGVLATLDSLSQYTVETEKAAVEQFRSNLGALSERLRKAAGEQLEAEFEQMPSDLRGILRVYRDRAERYIEGLKSDMKATSQALYQLLESIQGGDGDAESKLKAEVAQLESALRLDSVESMRAAIRGSVSRIGECVILMQREKHAIVGQLKNEIMVLQNRVEDLQRAATLDPATGISSKVEFVRLLRRAMTSGKEIGVMHLWLRNWRQLCQSSAAPMLDELIAAFAKRMKNAVPRETIAGRWRDEIFCLALPARELRTVSAAVATACSGIYACVHDGRTHRLALQCAVTCLVVHQGEELDALLARIEKIQLPE